MIRKLVFGFFLLGTPTLQAGPKVAVIDSGIDYKHSMLEALIWNNPNEIPTNDIDDDNNGYVDDTRGWNFSNKSATLIDYSEDSMFSPSIAKFLDIQSRSLIGKSTLGERKWAQNKLKDRRFVAQLIGYLNYAHGTHVAGIMTDGVADAEVIDARVIPLKNAGSALSKIVERIRQARKLDQEIGFIKEFVLKGGLYLLAKENSKIFAEITDYLANQDVRVANGSIGIGISQARSIVTPLLTLILQEAPEQKLVDEYASFFLKENVNALSKVFERSPNTLFVFAAGNDGFDNDQFPTSPASVGLENTIAVGASIDTVKVAPFSNTGALTVEVFAPGVAIESTAPMERTLSMSGTSQAAPYVANIATKASSINPKLTPEELKEIILATVDKKPFLKGLAYTEGIVNQARALKAAKISLTSTVDDAIAASLENVDDTQANIEESFDSVLVGKIFMPTYR